MSLLMKGPVMRPGGGSFPGSLEEPRTVLDSGCAALENKSGSFSFLFSFKLGLSWDFLFQGGGNLSLDSDFDPAVSATIRHQRTRRGGQGPPLEFVPNMWLKLDLGTLAIPVHPLRSWQDLGGRAGEGAPAAGLCQPRGDEVLAGQGILGPSLR